MIRSLKQLVRTIVPASMLSHILSAYHLTLALSGALIYGLPSRQLIVVGVTGTKGKSSTTEMIASICEAEGWKVAVLNSIRVKVAADSRPNTSRMSMPGRFFIQSFLARAVAAECQIAILEMTSEGARQHRHRGIDMDALAFLNLAPEHIESHGSYEAYADAKYSIGLQLVRSKKRPRTMVANADDAQGSRYLTLQVENRIPFSLAHFAPYAADDKGGYFTFEDTTIQVHVAGEFSLKNALAATLITRELGIHPEIIARGLNSLVRIPGRAEEIVEGQEFSVVVDYAHTPDSLEALYSAYANRRKICVLGSMGGGRDTWKRPVMGAIAEKHCDMVILTNEDPCDEDPRSIIDSLASQMTKTPTIVLNRREAIGAAIHAARPGDAVLITGKGTDSSIKGPNGSSTPWSDAQVAREEIHHILSA